MKMNPGKIKEYSNTEIQRKILSIRLNISYHKMHNIHYKNIVDKLSASDTHLDPQNRWSKEDYKAILYFAIEKIKQINFN